MLFTKRQCKLGVVEYLESVVAEIDFFTEACLACDPDNIKLQECLNQRRSVQLKRVDQLKNECLRFIETSISDQDLLHLDDLKTRIYRPFCYVIVYFGLAFLVHMSHFDQSLVDSLNLRLGLRSNSTKMTNDSTNQALLVDPGLEALLLSQNPIIKFDSIPLIQEMVIERTDVESISNLMSQATSLTLKLDMSIRQDFNELNQTWLNMRRRLKKQQKLRLELRFSKKTKSHQSGQKLQTINENEQISDLVSGLNYLQSISLDSLLRGPETLNKSFLLNMTSLEELRISRSSVRDVELDAFCNLYNLKRLSLDCCQLSDRTNWSFLNSLKPGLEYLNLSNNFISTVTADMFSNMPNLIELNLSGNFIRKVISSQDGLFMGSNRIEILDLSNTKDFSSLIDGTRVFENLNKLKRLAIDFRNGLFGKNNRTFKSLESLSLVLNNFHQICPDGLSGLDNLTNLELVSKNSEQVSCDLFLGLDNLTQLTLRSWQVVTAVDRGVFFNLTKLEKLSIHGSSGIIIREDIEGLFDGLESLVAVDISKSGTSIRPSQRSFIFCHNINKFVWIER